MGFSDSLGQIASGLGDLASAFGFDLGLTNEDGAIYNHYGAVYGDGMGAKTPWSFNGQDWYKIYGYQFVVRAFKNQSPANKLTGFLTGNNGDFEELIYTLPIPPQSLQIRMIPASQATPTIGGVVEETSANAFWLINMSGTTGIAVSRSGTGSDKRHKMAQQFRENVSTTGLLSGTLAGVNSAISKIGGAADALMDTGKAIADADGDFAALSAFTGGVVGAFNTAFLPPLPYSASAVKDTTNGFTEIQELHRFLYTYSKLKAAKPSTYDLKFRCYKTNQEWNCIVQDFGIQQSASNPMLYRYNIALKGWGVGEAGGKKEKAEFDRFGPNGDLKSVNLVTPETFDVIRTRLLK